MSKDCGIYLATLPIPAKDETIPAPRLVYYHNHSQEGGSMVILPEENTNNVWTFSSKGFLVSDKAFIDGLQPLKAQGYYRFREHFHPNEEEVVNKEALVQLGYNGAGEPIVFFPKPATGGANALEFPNSGMRIPPKIYDLLEPLDLVGTYVPKVKHIH